MSPLVLSYSSGSTGAGCHGTDVAEASSVCFSPIALLPGVLARVRRDEVRVPLVAPFWPGRVWFSDLISLLDGSPWEILSPWVYHPCPEMWKLWGWPLRGAQLIACGLSTEVVETILQSRAPSTRKLYALKWKTLDRQLDPVNCPIGTVLELLKARLSAGLTHSTLKVTWRQFGLPHLSWWAISGQTAPGYTFPPQWSCVYGR